LLVRCFAGCDSRQVLRELRDRGLGDPPPKSLSGSVCPSKRLRSEPDADAKALALWRAALPIAGTLGAEYLRQHRGIRLEPPPSLRFLESARYFTGHCFPALIAAVQRPDRKIVAVQLTYLRPNDGSKAPVASPRLTVGRLGTGAIRLGPAGEVLGLAEGTETALSVMEMSGVPCWATLGVSRLGKIAMPSPVREVHIFADDDDAGRLAAEKAAEGYVAAGLQVILRWPPAGCGDWNDALRARRAAA